METQEAPSQSTMWEEERDNALLGNMQEQPEEEEEQ